MALKVTRWNFVKCFLFSIDIIIFAINATLFGFTFYLIRKEYYRRASLKLFIVPFFVSIINVFIDLLMNKTNLMMKYAGHNRYGMITRFFMFYFILTIIIYSDQREKYVIKEEDIDANKFIYNLGLVDIGVLIFSMILGFFVIDVQNFNQILVRKKKKIPEPTGEEMGLIDNLIPGELDKL